MKNLKKALAVLLVLIMCFALVGCKDDKKKELPKEDDEEGTVHYRDIMVDYDELEPSDRIVILQTSLCFNGREGIYKEADVEAAVTIKYQGKDVPALKMKNCTKFLHNPNASQFAVLNKNGKTVVLTSNEFNALYVLSLSGEEYIVDFKKGTKTMLVKENGELVCDDFYMAVADTNEGVLNVNAKEEIQMKDILAVFGWDPDKTVNIVASDKFYVPDAVMEGERGSICGILSGTSVNAKILDTTIAQGKINDIIYIEKIVEAK